jgi:hypothetical protein
MMGSSPSIPSIAHPLERKYPHIDEAGVARAADGHQLSMADAKYGKILIDFRTWMPVSFTDGRMDSSQLTRKGVVLRPLCDLLFG